jgi:uncharacterized protein with HEPN domain
MSRGSPRLGDYLEHILEAIDRIQRYCDDMSEISFLESEITQDAVIRNFEIIGEASKNIERVADPEFRSTHPDLPLAFAYDMRNVLAHGYYKVDLGVVWKTIETDLPSLKIQIEKALRDL